MHFGAVLVRVDALFTLEKTEALVVFCIINHSLALATVDFLFGFSLAGVLSCLVSLFLLLPHASVLQAATLSCVEEAGLVEGLGPLPVKSFQVHHRGSDGRPRPCAQRLCGPRGTNDRRVGRLVRANPRVTAVGMSVEGNLAERR